MSNEARLRLEPPQQQDDQLIVAASLDDPTGHRHRLWYRLPAEWADAITDAADPFVLAFLFPMMQWGRPVRVEGRVSPSLLANLEFFMAIWHAWVPQSYRVVTIEADEEAEPEPVAEPGSTIVPFSAGIDSSFTIFRHARGMVGRRTRPIKAAVMMAGFDIWLDQPHGQAMYDALFADARIMLDSLNIPLVPVATNYHELPTKWKHSLGTHLMAGLMLFQRRFDHALFPNCIPYIRLQYHYGNHPLSTPLMSGGRFRIADDGGDFRRFEKIQVVAQWPEALQYVRVCFENPGSHRNCCRCAKCVRTILSFQTIGISQPPAFPRPLTLPDIRRTRFHQYELHMRQLTEVIEAAEAHGLSGEPWAAALRTARRRNRMRHVMKRVNRPFIPIRNQCRVLLRGSPLSRRELAERARSAPAVP